MIRTGDVLENPVTGERLRFLRTSRDTRGEAVVVEMTVQPNRAGAAAPARPYQVAQFRVVVGVVAFCVGPEKQEARAGDVVVVGRGTPHAFWNAGDEPARLIAVVRPALEFERLVETTSTLAADVRTAPNAIRSCDGSPMSRGRLRRRRAANAAGSPPARTCLRCAARAASLRTPDVRAGARSERAGAALALA
jgi:quercetin dioxygenase-like cupin family protein